MRKTILTIFAFMILLNVNAQIESLAGPRLGGVFISPSPASSFLSGTLKLEDMGELPSDYNDITKGALTSLYGWQFESRFADGYDVTGVVEWIVLVAGMEKGKFLPSLSSMVGARLQSGLEFAAGPNLSLAGIAMVFGIGYNFKSGDLNIPVNLAFVPGRIQTQDAYSNYEYQIIMVDPDGIPGTGDEYEDEVSSEIQVPKFDYNTGNRVSITVGFNLSR